MQNYLKTIVLLAFSSFCIGVAEFIISGILTPLSHYFEVSIAEVGYLATYYAVGVVLGAPIASVLTSKYDYKYQLIFTLLIFAFSNLAIYLSESFIIVSIARFISGLMHGLFFVISTLIAIRICPPNKVSIALSMIASGLALSLILGIPIGILLSEKAGILFPFLFIFILTICVSVSTFLIMKKIEGKISSFKNILSAFKHKIIICGFMVTAFTCGSQFVLYIYMRAFLEEHSWNNENISYIFLAYGAFALLGNLFGGKITGIKGSFFSMKFILISQIIVFTFMSVSFLINDYAVVWNIFLVAFFGFASISPLKMLSVHLARTYSPKTQNDAIALNESSFNVGIALASLIGGMAQSININLNGLFAGIFSFIAIVILIYIQFHVQQKNRD